MAINRFLFRVENLNAGGIHDQLVDLQSKNKPCKQASK